MSDACDLVGRRERQWCWKRGGGSALEARAKKKRTDLVAGGAAFSKPHIFRCTEEKPRRRKLQEGRGGRNSGRGEWGK